MKPVTSNFRDKAAQTLADGLLTGLGELNFAILRHHGAQVITDSDVSLPENRSGRLELAQWVIRPENPLTPRVFVNRVWQHHFGQGLVRTPSDFGVRSEAPTHPELLEFLAHDFVAHGWKLKRLHRMILTSAVWLQQSSSRANADANIAADVDPQNRLLWKMVPRRLEAEALRDNMLSVSGALNLEAGGPGFKPYIPPEANLARNIQGGDYPKDAKDDATTRRRNENT